MGVMMGKAPKTDKSHAVFKKISYIIINNYAPPPPNQNSHEWCPPLNKTKSEEYYNFTHICDCAYLV
jgi:hypothetical protein